MKTKFTFSGVLMIILISAASCKTEIRPGEQQSEIISEGRQEWAIVIHGGAGAMSKDRMTPETDKKYRAALSRALYAGREILSDGGSALDAVETSIKMMEDDPLFNAGRGSVFTNDGKNELDAAIMNGYDLSAGAVAGVTDVKNPITVARHVMTNSRHVFLVGAGASRFAEEQGLEIVSPSYFYTDERYKELQEILTMEKHGTVGCCALDINGNLAAGTSTGGMSNKKYNRVGDVPVIGAGTYANNNTCAVSATGHGEYFIRWTVAHDISALMEYKGLSVQEASELVVNDKLVKAGGSGGVICIDKSGNVSMAFNSPGMFRGFATADGKEGVYIYREDDKR